MARSQGVADLREYWEEFQNIERNKEHEEEEETAKTPDEGEQEAAWLQEVGYGFLVNKYQAGKELTEDEVHAITESLPSNHAEVVKRRVATLNATLRKKQKYTTKIDVRNIFPQQHHSDIPTAYNHDPGTDNSMGTRQPTRPSTLPRGLKIGSNGEHKPVKKRPAPKIPKCKSYEVPGSENKHPEKIDLDTIHSFPDRDIYKQDLGDSPSCARKNEDLEDVKHFSYSPHLQTDTDFETKHVRSPNQQTKQDLYVFGQCHPPSSTSGHIFSFDFSSPMVMSNSKKKEAKDHDSSQNKNMIQSVNQSSSELPFHHIEQNTSDLDTTCEDLCDGTGLQRSYSKESMGSLNSPSRSKSSSCDTLDSLDSGLESTSESQLNRDQSSSRDSLDNVGFASCFHGMVKGHGHHKKKLSLNSPNVAHDKQMLPVSPTTAKSSPKFVFSQQYRTKVRNSKMTEHSSKDTFSKESSPKVLHSPLKEKSLPLDSPLSAEDESSPTLVSLTEIPRSPTSPRGEVVHPEWAPNRNRAAKRQGSLLKNKGGYSMTGVSEEVQDNLEEGVETLSVQSKGTFQKRSSQLSPISDADIEFEFSIEESNGETSSLLERSAANRLSMNDDDLPNFSLVPDKLGLTTVDDISIEDQKCLKNLALLEFTSMLDTHNIQYSRRRSKRKYKEHGIFGVPLHVMIEHDSDKLQQDIRIPLVFQESLVNTLGKSIIDGLRTKSEVNNILSQILAYLSKHCLETEGILRVPGSTGRVKNLRTELEERFYHGTFTWSPDVTPHDVASLMKQFLRDLPTPLLTDEYIEAFAQVEDLPDKKQQLHALNLLILLLPNVHRDTLSALLDFLIRIIDHCDTNKMSLNNVAMIMAPNLFMAPKVRSSNPAKNKASWDLEVKMATRTSYMMKMLLRFKTILWTVPTYLLSLVRRQYEVEQIRKNKEKSKVKFLAKKDKTDVYKKPALKHESDFHEGVIRIQAPKFTKSSTAIQLDVTTTAGDIVSKFKFIQAADTPDAGGHSPNSHLRHTYNDPKNYHSAGDDTFLYEIGGNIGERCLPYDTNMMALYKVNPNAEWIIKKRDRSKVT